MRQKLPLIFAVDLGEAFECEARGFTHPGTKNDLIPKRGWRFVVDLVAQHYPSDHLLRFRAGKCPPMGDSNILDPAEVNGVVHVVLLVDIARQNRVRRFVRGAGRGKTS